MDKINLGCGIRFREGWENVDIVPTSDVVKRVDLRKPFPYEDNSFDIVYHSNVLEHFSLEDGNKFMFGSVYFGEVSPKNRFNSGI